MKTEKIWDIKKNYSWEELLSKLSKEDIVKINSKRHGIVYEVNNKNKSVEVYIMDNTSLCESWGFEKNLVKATLTKIGEDFCLDRNLDSPKPFIYEKDKVKKIEFLEAIA